MNDEITQADKLRVLRDTKVEVTPDERDTHVSQFGREVPRNTFLGRSLDLDEPGGRFAKIVPTVIVGTTAAPVYRAGPAWSRESNLPGDEEPLNQDINELPDMTKVQR